jgi:hypothetical protein
MVDNLTLGINKRCGGVIYLQFPHPHPHLLTKKEVHSLYNDYLKRPSGIGVIGLIRRIRRRRRGIPRLLSHGMRRSVLVISRVMSHSRGVRTIAISHRGGRGMAR